MPTLLVKGLLKFHRTVKMNAELEKQITTLTPIQIILKQLNEKLTRTGLHNRIYFLHGRTGSGKSTLFVSELFLNSGIIEPETGMKIICSEPRVVLTKSNALSVERYNKSMKLGENLGVLSGLEKIKCNNSECVYYCTTQILNDILLKILQTQDKRTVVPLLRKYKVIIIDEVHILELPVMSMLKTIKEVLIKYSDIPECPLFVFSSATINTDQLCKYYFGSTEILNNYLMYCSVEGETNFPVEEIFLSDEEIEEWKQSEQTIQYTGVITEYYMQKWYPTIFTEERANDVLMFIPLTRGIIEIGSALNKLIPDSHFVNKDENMSEVLKWRNENRNKKRALILGFARNFSTAADYLMSFSIDPDPESRLNEVKIILSTSIIEAGKTLSNLGLCIDLGIQTASIYNPLKFNINEKMYTLKQVPINLNQMVQRLGRIGRESPGIFVHFYSKTVVDKLLLNDYPDTINNPCLSNLILSYMKGVEKGKSIDIINENDFLYQTSVDILINSGRDLLNAGYLTKFGELVQLKNTYEFSDNWISYVMHLHLILGFSLWESLVLVCVNRKKLPPYFSIESHQANHPLYL